MTRKATSENHKFVPATSQLRFSNLVRKTNENKIFLEIVLDFDLYFQKDLLAVKLEQDFTKMSMYNGHYA